MKEEPYGWQCPALWKLEGPQVEFAICGSRFGFAMFDVLVCHGIGIRMKRCAGIDTRRSPIKMVVLGAGIHKSRAAASDVCAGVHPFPGNIANVRIGFGRSDLVGH